MTAGSFSAGPSDGFSTMDREINWDSSNDTASRIRAISLLVWIEITGRVIGRRLKQLKYINIFFKKSSAHALGKKKKVVCVKVKVRVLRCYSVELLSRDSCRTRGAAARGEVRRLRFLSSALFPSVMAGCLLKCATVN